MTKKQLHKLDFDTAIEKLGMTHEEYKDLKEED